MITAVKFYACPWSCVRRLSWITALIVLLIINRAAINAGTRTYQRDVTTKTTKHGAFWPAAFSGGAENAGVANAGVENTGAITYGELSNRK